MIAASKEKPLQAAAALSTASVSSWGDPGPSKVSKVVFC
jgi:hypothetical protein